MLLPRRTRRHARLVVAYALSIASLSSRVSAYNYYNYYNYNNGGYNGNANNYYNNNNNYNYNYNNQNYNNDDGNANNNNDDQNNANYQGDDQANNYAGDDGGGNAGNDDAAVANDDAAAAANDDAAAADANDDAAAAANDDAAGDAAANDDAAVYNDDFDADKYGDDAAAAQYDAALEDDLFHWNSNLELDGVSIMPVSCVTYNNGHMIKFEIFETENSYQCHFAQIGTFVVSIAHYMRAHFNYQALEKGRDFSLPSDAGYLNCILLQEQTSTAIPLYAKIGCMERETFTSTKLQLHVYKDAQCSVPFDDGKSARYHANRGYLLDNSRGEQFLFITKVTFRPPFYTCQSCTVEEISDTFNKKYGTWYDDDYISQNGQKQQQQAQNEANNQANQGNDDAYANNDDQANNQGDYYDDGGQIDDTYMSANDDIYRYNNGGNRALSLRRDWEESHPFTHADGQLERFEEDFWRDVDAQRRQRELYDNSYSIDDWNMCRQVYKYGLYCDEQCRSLDAFRTDRWSGADIILLSIMCTFMAAMMLLIVAKRLRVSQKQRLAYQYYENDTEVSSSSMPGLPPMAMFAIFLSVMIIIIVLAEMKFVNETLVFAVVTCVLLFIYMLKLTLFASRKPVLLAAPKHDMFDNNALDERLYK